MQVLTSAVTTSTDDNSGITMFDKVMRVRTKMIELGYKISLDTDYSFSDEEKTELMSQAAQATWNNTNTFIRSACMPKTFIDLYRRANDMCMKCKSPLTNY
jgi:hypothetical protein